MEQSRELDLSAVGDLDMELIERAVIAEGLRRAGSVAAASRLLKISRFALGRRMRKLGIPVPDPGPRPKSQGGKKRGRKPKVTAPVEQVATVETTETAESTETDAPMEEAA